MRKFERTAEPAFLAENWVEWGVDWDRRHGETPPGKFSWRHYEKVPVNQLLLEPLAAQTQDHCSFCDAFPVSPPSDDTIEHFQPKAEYPRKAYHWPNLYLCCRFCQRKEGAFDEAVLRPDADDYSFDRYFRWDYTLGRLEVNPQAKPEDQSRACLTIEYFRFNEKHPRFRLLWQHLRLGAMTLPLDEFAYRHFLEDDPADS